MRASSQATAPSALAAAAEPSASTDSACACGRFDIGGGAGNGCLNAGEGALSIFEISGDGMALSAPPNGRSAPAHVASILQAKEAAVWPCARLSEVHAKYSTNQGAENQ